MTEGMGAYIPFNDDEPEIPEMPLASCANHTIFVNGACMSCGEKANAILKAEHKMIMPTAFDTPAEP